MAKNTLSRVSARRQRAASRIARKEKERAASQRNGVGISRPEKAAFRSMIDELVLFRSKDGIKKGPNEEIGEVEEEEEQEEVVSESAKEKPVMG